MIHSALVPSSSRVFNCLIVSPVLIVRPESLQPDAGREIDAAKTLVDG